MNFHEGFLPNLIRADLVSNSCNPNLRWKWNWCRWHVTERHRVLVIVASDFPISCTCPEGVKVSQSHCIFGPYLYSLVSFFLRLPSRTHFLFPCDLPEAASGWSFPSSMKHEGTKTTTTHVLCTPYACTSTAKAFQILHRFSTSNEATLFGNHLCSARLEVHSVLALIRSDPHHMWKMHCCMAISKKLSNAIMPSPKDSTETWRSWILRIPWERSQTSSSATLGTL